MTTPLTPAQHGVWLTGRTLDTGTAYHLAVTLDLTGPLDADALDRACAAVVARHPVLASRFAPDGTAAPTAAVAPPRRVDCAPADLDKLLDEERAAPFDPATGPLCRFALFRPGAERHVLLVTAHHLVLDGESKERLVADLATAYRGEPLDPAAAPADPPTPALEAPALEAATAYWASRWREPAAPVLPGLAPPPDGGVRPAPGAEAAFRLDGRRCADTARALGVTRFELLTAAWHALLARYGDPAPTTAVELSLRRPGDPVALGLAVNELPLRPGEPADRTFADWTRTVRAELRALYAHRAVPLGRAVPGLTPRTALTPLSVSYRRRPAAAAPDFGPLTARVGWTGFAGTARNLLHLHLVDCGEEVLGSLQYRTGALDAATAARIAGHYTALLDAAHAAPDTPVAALEFLAPDERAAQLAAPAPRPDLPATTVPARFAARAAAHPDAVAAVADGTPVTYGELARLVAHAAAALTRHGAGPGRTVGIALPRGLDQLVAVLAVLATGAAHLPLDPDYPAAHLAFVRDDARLALRITDRPEQPGDLTPADLAPADAGTPPLPPAPDPALPAYVLYTSGTTGRPKGVEVPHSALANVLGSLRDRLGATPADRWLALTSLAFDISAVELLLPLTTGARVVLAPPGAHRDGPALLALLREQRITHVQATPSGWQLLLDAGLADTALTALTGGEALPAPLAAALTAATARLVNVYGPTETTIWSTCADPALDEHGAVTLGEPLDNTRAYVLDQRLRPVPYGVPGELHLAGDGVAHGYRGRPGLTASRFRPDPYGPPGARMYRTGDLVRRAPDGALEYLGRADTQVKLRGHRLELGAVEARLATHPGVARAAAALRGADRLVAYVVPAGPAPDPAELRAHLAAVLPAAVLPNAYAVLDTLPLTPNGKLDRAALPDPGPARPDPAPAAGSENTGSTNAGSTNTGTGDAGPEDAVLAAVLAIWADVLELDDLGPDEDLFDLGGHSLTITAIAARVSRTLGVDVPLDVFFDEPTARGVAAAVRALQGATP
ncbi:amino acid adenylation domain-containing protein [Kitasatospora sp. SolWspMP-SS2h]|uniref:non-ribosomal peptide synthetase n=1 Tax=Kitasatospora sp. SolWspMP-SS2h TaxID=1305729 RepID=UPI000DB98F6D|nr:non-ribosomal peptide synthetase [Kitasatospora sp. SolWspMP-SS2h]RAJ46824.1 amino acid adenylation domain-containing protein [Kitasatospora sp. SolWspMP-SS2h]